MHADQTTCSFPVNISVPQGSVIRPLGFAAYTEDVADVINRHSVLFQLYVDDKQIPRIRTAAKGGASQYFSSEVRLRLHVATNCQTNALNDGCCEK